MRKNGEHLEIITVCVDDLLLFSTSNNLMNKMKDNIKYIWEVTDLGDLAKIIGIEIAISKNSIIISQEKYIKKILKKEKECSMQIWCLCQ